MNICKWPQILAYIHEHLKLAKIIYIVARAPVCSTHCLQYLTAIVWLTYTTCILVHWVYCPCPRRLEVRPTTPGQWGFSSGSFHFIPSLRFNSVSCFIPFKHFTLFFICKIHSVQLMKRTWSACGRVEQRII